MRIGLFGFGKTGRAAANVIIQNKDYSLEWVFRRSARLENRSVSEFLGIKSSLRSPGIIYSGTHMAIEDLLEQHPVDIIIDFSSKSGIYSYGEKAAEKGIKIISAISEYSDNEKELLKKLSNKTVVFWSPNITLGVNYLLFAAKFLKKIAPWVDVEIIEEHFKGKPETSGTAKRIAEALDIKFSEINSIRAGGIVGKHQVVFGFPYQTVRLIHESISREAFGNGVLFVADNLTDKKPGLYSFEDILMPFFAAEIKNSNQCNTKI